MSAFVLISSALPPGADILVAVTDIRVFILSIRGKKIPGDAFVGNRDVRCDTNLVRIGVADTICLALMGGSNL
jgi:hypothetical protein